MTRNRSSRGASRKPVDELASKRLAKQVAEINSAGLLAEPYQPYRYLLPLRPGDSRRQPAPLSDFEIAVHDSFEYRLPRYRLRESA